MKFAFKWVFVRIRKSESKIEIFFREGFAPLTPSQIIFIYEKFWDSFLIACIKAFIVDTVETISLR